MSNPMKVLAKELIRLNEAQKECIKDGVVKPSCRYKFQLITEQILHLKTTLEWIRAVKPLESEVL